MESLELNIIKYQNNYKDYICHLSILKEQLKQNNMYKQIIESLDSMDSSKIYLLLFFFQNNDKWLNINLHNNNNNQNDNIMKIFTFKIINNEDKDNEYNSLFNIIIHWNLFLYLELVKNISTFSNTNRSKISKIKYLLKETNIMILKLYKSNIFKSGKIFDLLNFFLFLITNNYGITNNSDNIFIIKNSILLKEFFSFFQEITIFIFNNLNSDDCDKKNTKKDIQNIFKIMDDIKNNKEMNSERNKTIILKNYYLDNYISSFLKTVAIEKLYEYEPEFKNKLINFYSNFLIMNYKKTKIFANTLNSLKSSFINLYYFDKNKEKIFRDFFVQGFYLKLMKKLFFFDEKKNVSIPKFNSFFFNGFDSEISLNLQNNKILEKSSFFFSFNIVPIINREKYSLFILEKDINAKHNINKELVYEIYLQKVNKKGEKNNSEQYDLYISINNTQIKINFIKKIMSNITYFFSITFNGNKININYLNEKGGKEDIVTFDTEMKKKIFDSNPINLIFGFGKKEETSFSGYIGPIIVIKNQTLSKEANFNSLIPIILKMKNYYQYFIFFGHDSNYSFEYFNHYTNNNTINLAKKELETKIDFECFLYLTPDIIDFYKEKFDGADNNLPPLDDICKNQKDYKINNLNVTLVKHERGINNFIMNNGLDYICLLYEYIYQYMRNYFESEKKSYNITPYEYHEKIIRIISSLLRKSLFFFNTKNIDLNVNNLNKSFKQAFSNLFACIKQITYVYYIINDLIHPLFSIINNYHSSILFYIKNKDKSDSFKIKFMKIQLKFLNGLIDFLLNPELYDFKKNKILILLFDKLSLCFNFDGAVEASEIINQYIFKKLQNFANFLNYYDTFELIKNIINDDNKNNNVKILNFDDDSLSNKDSVSNNDSSFDNDSIVVLNKNKNIEEKEEKNLDVLNYYLKALKSFFENNPLKNDNIIYLKEIFHYINDSLENNYQSSLMYYDFINEIIGKDPDLYYNDDNNNEEIKGLLKFIKHYYKEISSESKNIKNEKIINKKKEILNKLVSIIMRIIFTKKRINSNEKVIRYFIKLIKSIDISYDLIDTITEELKNIIINSLDTVKTKKQRRKSSDRSENKEKIVEKIEIKIYSSEELDYVSHFYSEIFNIIKYFLEYPINNNNIELANQNEEKIFQLLEYTKLMIKSNIDNSIEINKEQKNDNNESITVDTIYCLISFIKFYNELLFQKLNEVKYIENFIKVCELCYKSTLINSNILINLGDCSKTILEIILDICFFYITNSSRKFYEIMPQKEINLVKNDSVIKEHKIIYDFLNNLLINYGFDKNKEMKKKKYSIFYNNDYFRLLSENNFDLKKISKKETNSELLNLSKNYRIIDNILKNEQKFNLNFTTFFLIKLFCYNKILDELFPKLKPFGEKLPIFKDFSKLIEKAKNTEKVLYIEHNDLSCLNKDFFFKNKKSNLGGFREYNEVKSRIEFSLKKKEKDFSSVNNNYLNSIYNLHQKNIFNEINSGLSCKKGKEQLKTSFTVMDMGQNKLYKPQRTAHSSIDVISDISNKKEKKKSSLDEHLSVKTFQEKKPKINFQDSTDEEMCSEEEIKKKSSEEESKNKNSQNEEKNEYQLTFKEESPTPPSENEIIRLKSHKNIIRSVKESNSSVPYTREYKRIESKKKSVNSTSIPLQKYFILKQLQKKDLNKEKEKLIVTLSSTKSNLFINNNKEFSGINYLNFFDKPDECYLKNPKKELMMTIFSNYFFDSFFINNEFELMKRYYIQNLEGVQDSTKLLNYPSRNKNYSNGLDAPLFLKPFSSFFGNKTFPLTHKYFYDYMVKNNIFPEPIILYQKDLPLFNINNNQFVQKCELIKIDHNFFGHIIGSTTYNYIIFEEQKYEFYEEYDNIIKKKIKDPNELEDIFTLSVSTKKPKSERIDNIGKKLEKISSYRGKKNREKKTIIILFNEIEEIIERRFLLMWQAIEIYLKNGKSYFFNFISEKNCKTIVDIFKTNNITKDKVHETDNFKTLKNITSEWTEERLSTFEYLLFINKFGSRTFNDTNQYPVFPWLIKYSSNEKKKKEKRNLQYPMAVQNETNKEEALNRYNDEEENGNKFPIHFGTHYSTSAYIYFYLMREEPYTTLVVKFQGYKQENPDRMLYNINEVLFALNTGHDNRELIPEFYYKIEHLINLNCVDYGRKSSNLRVDDFIISYSINNKYRELSSYVKYIIDNKKFLESKEIKININKWFDNIFGINQIPEKNKKQSFNIFSKYTYEENINLHKKLEKIIQKQDERNITTKGIIHKIVDKIELINSFGQTPYKLFNYQHPNYGKKNASNEEEDFELQLTKEIWSKDAKESIKNEPLFFVMNHHNGLIFLINYERKLEIKCSTLFDPKNEEKSSIKKYEQIQLPHMFFYEKINLNIKETKSYYYIIKQKYCISIFDEIYKLDKNVKSSTKNIEILNNSNGDNDSENNNILKFNDTNNNDDISYYNLYLNNLNNKSEKKSSKKNMPEEYYMFITCRYIDKSFKVHLIPKNKSKLKTDYLMMSVICEDYVSSCCTISGNKFLVGLSNGKLLKWSIEIIIDDILSTKQNKPKLNIKLDQQIQAHKKSINVIEINHRLGIIITAGYDHYVFIRKIYDMELLVPIKFKKKYIITMAKVSPMNFLYIMCYNKNRKKSVIFGYSLNGLIFAKSSYNYYETIDFTKKGNIVTWIHKKEIQILNSYDLKKIYILPSENNQNKKNYSFINVSLVNFTYFTRKNEQDSNIKIITFINNDKKNNKLINHLDVTKNSDFD